MPLFCANCIGIELKKGTSPGITCVQEYTSKLTLIQEIETSVEDVFFI